LDNTVDRAGWLAAAGGASGTADRADGAQGGGVQVSRALSGPPLLFRNFPGSLIDCDFFLLTFYAFVIFSVSLVK
jgi:hypothetical protein